MWALPGEPLAMPVLKLAADWAPAPWAAVVLTPWPEEVLGLLLEKNLPFYC
jgi:hypothetical protein